MAMTNITIGQFRLTRLIGKGAMADVWEGIHRNGQQAAIKIVTNAQKQDVMAQFRNETHAASKLNHPNIINLYDVGLIDEATSHASRGAFTPSAPYLVMELASNLALKDMIPCEDFAHVLHVARDVLKALAHAHARGVIHRDIKPSNILIEHGVEHNIFKVSDFGISHALFSRDDPSTKDERLQGTPYYMAPEQIRGLWREQGPWTDLYAFGCVLYRLVTGQLLRSGTFQQVLHGHLHDPLPRLKPLFPVPPHFERWLAKMLDRDIERRYRFGADALNDLEHMQASLEPLTPTSPLARSVQQTHNAQHTKAHVERAHEMAPAIRTLKLNVPDHWEDPSTKHVNMTFRGIGLGLFGLKRACMVGRRLERDILWDAFKQTVLTRQPHMVLLEGPSGIGKTQIAKWLAQRTAELGLARAILASYHPDNGPLDGLPYALAKRYNLLGLPKSTIRRAITRWMHTHKIPNELATPLSTTLSTLWSTWSVPPTPEASKHLEPEHVTSALTQLIEQMPAERALVLHLDDVQWANRDLDIVRNLMNEDAAHVPILIIATIQSDASESTAQWHALRDDFNDHPRVHSMHIKPMHDTAISSLVRALIGLEPTLERDIIARSKGQPIFTVELISELVASDALMQGPMGYTLRDNMQASMPKDVEALWLARIEHVIESLPNESQDDIWMVLELASMMNGEFEIGIWKMAALQLAISISNTLLNHLSDTGILRIEKHSVHLSHQLLVECLREHARKHGRWKALNSACAYVLAAQGEQDMRCMEHWVEAQEYEHALTPLQRMMEDQFNRGKVEDMRKLVEIHHKILDNLPHHPRAHAEQSFYSGVLIMETGERSKAITCFNRALEAAIEHDWYDLQSMTLIQHALICREAARPLEAHNHLEAALIAAQHTSRHDLQVGILQHMAHMNIAQGNANEALAPLKIILELCKGNKDLTLAHISSLIDQSAVFSLMGKAQEAHDAVELAIEMSQNQGILRLIALALTQRGELHRNEGQHAEAILDYDQALSMFSFSESPRVCAPIHLNIALSHLERRHTQEAKHHLYAAMNLSKRLDIHYINPFVHLGLLICFITEGRMDRCVDLLSKLQKDVKSHDVQYPKDLRMLLVTAMAQAEDLEMHNIYDDLNAIYEHI